MCHLLWSRAGVAHVCIEWNHHPVLLLATRLLTGRDTWSFQYEKGAAYDRQQIQMGLRKGNTVLVHYRRGSALYQSVLIMQDADLRPGKVSKEQHKYWRYVSPVRSFFDWLPKKIARTFCNTALDAYPDRQYGELHHLEDTEDPRYATMTFQNIFHIGDTKSQQELEVLLTMPLERLRIGCGIQCTETLLPLGPNQRPRLYTAAIKLLRFAIGLEFSPLSQSCRRSSWGCDAPSSPTPGRARACHSKCGCDGTQRREDRPPHRRGVWCWKNPLCCSTPSRTISL